MHPISSLLALVALCTFGATAAPAYYVPECAQGSESPKCWAVASPIYNDEPCTGSGNGGAVPTATPTYTWKPTPTSTPYTTDIATPSSSSSAAATSSAPASYPRPAPTAGASRNVVAYFANWKQSYQVTDLPVEDLTHVIYAFTIPKNGVAVLTNPDYDAKQMPLLNSPTGPVRKRNPSLQSLLSIGGWTGSAEFSTIARSASARAAFVKSLVDLVGKYGFDGADIDWEYPGTDGNDGNAIDAAHDGNNFTLLLRETRAALAKLQATTYRKQPYLLTVATGAAANAYSKLDMAGLAANVDFVNVMTYDAAGAWSPATGANAGMSLINAAIAGYRAAGLPAHQLQIGIPLYARAFAGVKFSGNKAQIVTGGLPFNKAVAAPGTVEPSVVDYNDLAANYLPTYSKGYDTVENSLTVWNEQKGIWISAEDATTAKIKANLAVTHGLAGVFVWEPSQETTNTVIRAIKVALN